MDTGVPFLLTIEFDGGSQLSRLAARIQSLSRKFGFKPTWLVGVGALRHPSALEPLAQWQKEGEGEVGGLLDPAAVPPLVDLGPLADGAGPFLTDFPESVMDEKLAWFTQTMEQTLGKKPITLRTARPSVDDRYYALLARHGYKVDMTVVPHAKIGRSDFSGYSEKPYLTPQGVFEIPRTVRRHRYGPLVEDLQALPGIWGKTANVFFPPVRCFRLRQGNNAVLQQVAGELTKAPPGHLDLRIARQDWGRGEGLVRDLERTLALVQTRTQGLTAEEFLHRFKTEQLRKGLV